MSALPPAALVDIGGRRLTARSGGIGRVCVVFEGGLGIESVEWAAVAAEVAAHARVLIYDRANRGDSDPVPQPRSVLDAVRDLRAVLAQAGVAGPLLLVGHSFGGVLARLHAFHHPAEVAGLVLVDPMHEDQFDVLGPVFPVARPDEPAHIAGMRRFWTGGWRDPRNNRDGFDLATARTQAQMVTTLGAMPLHLLTAGSYLNEREFPQAAGQRLQQLWQSLHVRLLAQSTRAAHRLVLDSGHFMQRDRPDVIAAVILDLLTEIA
jgi:pimeloyl-ACP methyl ester carboxylesterase